ncbi:MAG: MBL fold metallo-hydrolase [Acidimicrobiales bacterium]
MRRLAAGWTDEPVHTLVYTHGHVDHVGGSGHIVRDAEAAATPR